MLEQKARDLAVSVEKTRQQILLQSNKKIKALEQKACDLADFVETLRNQTRQQFESEIAAMEQTARALAVSVEASREMTLLQSDSEIEMLGHSHDETVTMNEALVLGVLRQHELTEAAENLNAQLQTEIIERKQAEQALRENEWRLRYATESARLTYVEVDLARGGARTAENFAAVMGYVPPLEQETDVSVGNRLLLEHIVFDDRPRVEAALQEFQDGTLTGKVEYRVLGDDQIERWIETRWSVELAADGKPLKSFATNLDISERKQAEKALRESEERVRLALDSAELGSWNIEPVTNLLTSDQRFRAIFGVTGEELAYEECFAIIHPDDRGGVRDLVAAATRLDDPVPYEAKYRVAHADGSLHWVLAKGRANFGNVGAERMLLSFDGTLADITEPKRAEEALRLSEERFRTLFDQGPIAMYVCDASGSNREFNRVAIDLWGLDSKGGNTLERIGGPFKIFLPDGTCLPYAETPMTKVLQGILPTVHDMELVIERRDGSRINVIANIVPLKNDQGEITGAINCFYDITERSRLERQTNEQAEALADLHRRKDEFLAMLSHELRNPLAPISNAVHLLRLQKNEDPVQSQARGIIERQVGQLTLLIDDLMEVSRISTGRIHLHEERVVLNGIVKNALETVRPLMVKHRHSLEVYLSPQPIWLYADGARLEQVVVNLLTNAAKYTDEGGSIRLSVQQEGDEAVLRVKDTGVGIAPELLPHVFDLFTQAERSLDRSQGGLGIGLCLVKRLVEMHRGTVEVVSTLREGSEFTVRLPVSQTFAPSPSPTTEKTESKGHSLRVLVVEDNVDAAETLKMVLEASGHVVRMAHDGHVALETAVDFLPQVMLLDIGLPGINGFELAKLLREQPPLSNIVLVAMTGYGEAAARQRSQEAGFDHHLVKPADFAKLQEILRSVSDNAVL